jgi:hypothetical protein
MLRTSVLHSSEPDLAAWRNASRLNLTHGIPDHMGDPRVQSALARSGANMAQALKNADTLLELAIE